MKPSHLLKFRASLSAFQRLIRRAIREWQAWEAERRLMAIAPDVAAAREAVQRAERQHQPTRKPRKALTAAIHNRLRREIAR